MSTKALFTVATIFVGGTASAAAGTLPVAGPADELVWIILAATGFVTVAGLEAG